MVATYSANLRLTKQGDNDNPNTWGQVVNTQVIQLLEDAIAGVVAVDCTGSADVSIASTTSNGSTDDARHAVLELTGVLGADILFSLPAVEKIYLIRAAQTGGYTITVKPVGGVSGIAFVTGKISMVYTNGTNIYEFSADVTNLLNKNNNLSDVTNVVTALSNLGGQPIDATLTALAAYNTNGLFTQTAHDTFTARTITGTANQITVTNGDGVAGNPTLAINVGTTANKILQLDGSAKIPAVDGSQLTNMPVPTNPIKAWVVFNMSTGTIASSNNVSSVTINGTGIATINFTSSLADINYAVSGSSDTTHAIIEVLSALTTSCQVQTKIPNAGGNNSPARTSIIIVGN